ncbi:MAG: phage head closure protein [Pseudomonadota bacterium]
MPAVGALRRRVRLDVRQDVVDDAGGTTRHWVSMGEVFAKVQPRRRRESVSEGRPLGLVTHRIVMRWRDDVDGNWRIVDGSRVFRIMAVEPDDARHAFLACLCEEEQT